MYIRSIEWPHTYKQHADLRGEAGRTASRTTILLFITCNANTRVSSRKLALNSWCFRGTLKSNYWECIRDPP